MDEIAGLYETVGLDPPKYSREDLIERTGVDRSRSVKWWRAMGFPEVAAGERAFGEDDVRMIQRLAALTEATAVDDETILRLARLLGASGSRIAEAQVETVEHTGATSTDIDAPTVSLLTDSLLYVWRRHLLAALGRRMQTAEPGGERAVGFADLAGFTQRATELELDRLAELVDRFEEIASDVVSTHGGRAVKFVGDEVMFVADTFEPAVDIALELVDRLREVPDMPLVHCGLAFGPTVTVGGDVFGPAVNLAARLRSVARPGTVLMPDSAADLLAGRDDIDVVPLRRRYPLKGVGDVRVASVRRL